MKRACRGSLQKSNHQLADYWSERRICVQMIKRIQNHRRSRRPSDARCTSVEGVKYDELGEIELPSGETRRCKVLEVNGDNALVQLFESVGGHQPARQQGALLGTRHFELAVSEDMLGRVFCRHGSSDRRRSRRSFPRTSARHQRRCRSTRRHATIRRNSSRPGVSAIDGLNTLVRGQKLPIFSASGLPHAKLAAQIAPSGKGTRNADDKVRRCLCRNRYHL